MKKKLLALAVATTVFAFGASLLVHYFDKPIEQVDAAQVIDNFDEYAYSGDYYDNIEGTDGLNGTLRTSLTTLIHPKDWYTYSGSGSDHLSTILQSADEDPTNKSNMIYLYTRDSVKKNAASSWNREHVWPQSLSNGCWGTGDGGGSDLLHIRPTYNDTNGARGNLLYGDVNKAGIKTYNSMVYGYSSGNYFEPLDSVKGDVARIIMYTWVAYKNHYSNLPNITSVFQSYDILIKWHTMDKPDVMEGHRNDFSETSIQKNRNPFVDHPEYAWKIFGDSVSASVRDACIAAYPGDGSTTTKTMTGIAISGEANVKTYYEGDQFNPEGLIVTASYDDNSTKVVSNTNCVWSPNPLTKGTTSVTCSYNGFTATYAGITVNERQPSEGGVYKVEFTKTSDTGTPITSSTISQYYASNTLVNGVSSINEKVFPGKSGLKLGSSSANGSITFTIKDEAKTNIIKIEIETTSYNGSGTYSANLGSISLADSQPAGTTLSKTLNSVTASTISIVGNGRLYLNSITIETQPTSPIYSSSEPVSSSEQFDSSNTAESSSQPQESCIDTTSSVGPSAPEQTSEQAGNSSNDGSDQPNKKHGCFGSLGIVSLTGVTALIGLVFIFSKKRK